MRSAHSNCPQTSALILLVDDNRDGVLARRAVLEELGYQVVSACCGPDALKRIEEYAFDLVITDYKMEPMNGVELISRLRECGFAKPILLLSGFADAVGLNPETTGADVVVQKSANEVATLVRHTRRLVTPKKPASSQTRKQTRAQHSGH
jgi:CheY-like chemotaxis protein